MEKPSPSSTPRAKVRDRIGACFVYRGGKPPRPVWRILTERRSLYNNGISPETRTHAHRSAPV